MNALTQHEKVIPTLFISIFFTLFLNSCYTQSKLSESYKLHEGMTKSEVEAIMGVPVKSDINKNIEEWHYCRTDNKTKSEGEGAAKVWVETAWADEFLSVFFYDGKLVATKNYTVTSDDAGGATGSCEKFIKMGTYIEPEKVTEIRIR